MYPLCFLSLAEAGTYTHMGGASHDVCLVFKEYIARRDGHTILNVVGDITNTGLDWVAGG